MKKNSKQGTFRHGNQEPPGQAPRYTGQEVNNTTPRDFEHRSRYALTYIEVFRADAVAKRYRPWPKGLRTDSLPWFDSPLVQGVSRLRSTDKAQCSDGHTGRKALATKKKKVHRSVQSMFNSNNVQRLIPHCFFCCERLSASMARSLHLSFICRPQSARALDQGGVEPRQAVSPKALRPWTIPLRYSVG